MVEESGKSQPVQKNERTWAVYRSGVQLPQPKLKEHLSKKIRDTCGIQDQEEQHGSIRAKVHLVGHQL